MAIEQQAPPAALETDLGALRDLLENNEVEHARALVKELTARWPDSAAVARYDRLLAKPVALVVPGHQIRRLDEESAWLRAHAHEHPGCWLAVRGSELIAAGSDYGAVLTRVRAVLGHEDVVLYRQP